MGSESSKPCNITFLQDCHTQWIKVAPILMKIAEKQLKLPAEYEAGFREMTKISTTGSHEYGGWRMFLAQITHSHTGKSYKNIMTEVVPYMAELVLEFMNTEADVQMEYHQYYRGFHLDKVETKVILGKKVVSSLIAMGFFCLYPRQKSLLNLNAESLNFNCFASHTDVDKFIQQGLDRNRAPPKFEDHQVSKLQCILNYFSILLEGRDEESNDSFILQKKVMGVKFEGSTTNKLCELSIQNVAELEKSEGVINQLCFLPEQISNGDVLGEDCPQDAIKFLVCPELLACLLLMTKWQKNEAIVVSGFEQFSKYSGCGRNFQYIPLDSQNEPVSRDPEGRLKNTLVALSATDYNKNSKEQYREETCFEEIKRACFGFLKLIEKIREFEESMKMEAAAAAMEVTEVEVNCVDNSDDSKENPQLKMILRWIAASEAGVTKLTYYTKDEEQLKSFLQAPIIKALVRETNGLAQLYSAVDNACSRKHKEKAKSECPKLFEIILDHLKSTHVDQDVASMQ